MQFLLDSAFWPYYTVAGVLIVGFSLWKIARANKTSSAKSKQLSGKSVLAGLLVASGVSGMGYFFLFFQTAVRSGDHFVNNIGLLQDRQNGIIISAVALIVGVLIGLLGGRSGPGEPPQKSS